MYSLRDWQTIEKNPAEFIVNASRTNGSDSEVPFPIGFCYFWHNIPQRSLIKNHSETVLFAVNITTDERRRSHLSVNRHVISYNLEKNGIKNKNLESSEYFGEIGKYKFIISPEGNGLDCHRHYEALMFGCIPIVERNPHIAEKYAGCPILWTTDYSEITPEYLENKYSEMVDKVYDFSRLFLSYYSVEVQKQIRENSEFWKPKTKSIPRLINGRFTLSS
jgi:hypothetical protein